MARPRSDIAPRILESARRRFLADGVDGASLRRIAKDAKTSIGMIYYYFPTKDDLFLAAVEEVYAGLLADLEVVLSPPGTAAERLSRLYRRIASASDREIAVVRLLVREVLLASDRVPRLFARFQRGHIPLIVSTLRDGVSEGTVDGRHHPILLMLCVLLLGGLPQIVMRLLGDQPMLAGAPRGDALADELVAMLLGGIGPPAKERVTPPARAERQGKGTGRRGTRTTASKSAK